MPTHVCARISVYLILPRSAGLQTPIDFLAAGALRSPAGCPAEPRFTCQLMSSASPDHSHLCLYSAYCKCPNDPSKCCAGLQPPSASGWQELCAALPALQAAALRLVGVLMQATRAALLAHFGAVARLLAGFLQVFCAKQGRLLHTFARPVRQQVRGGHHEGRHFVISRLGTVMPGTLCIPPGQPVQGCESSNLWAQGCCTVLSFLNTNVSHPLHVLLVLLLLGH